LKREDDVVEGNLRKHFFSLVIEELNKTIGRLPSGMTFASLYKEA
jgi:hypothetical protein